MFKDVIEYLDKRSYSTIIVVFFVFWVICHSQGFATMLFTDQELIFEKYGLLKNEYLNQYFFGHAFDFCSNPWHAIDFWLRFIAPFFLTYLYIWHAPKWFINKAYDKQINYKTDRDISKEIARQRLIEMQEETTKAEINVTKEQTKLAEENKRLEKKDPKSIWRREYKTFIDSSSYYSVLSQLKEVVYERRGFFNGTMSTNNVMLCDTNDLVSINDNKLTLTEKGKFFLKCFSENNK